MFVAVLGAVLFNLISDLLGGVRVTVLEEEVVLRRVGAQYEDDLNSRSLDAATTLDAFAAWPLASRLQLVARGENLFDATVEAAVNGDGSIERATPRTLWIGLRLRSGP